jgi:hypothetical protein
MHGERDERGMRRMRRMRMRSRRRGEMEMRRGRDEHANPPDGKQYGIMTDPVVFFLINTLSPRARWSRVYELLQISDQPASLPVPLSGMFFAAVLIRSPPRHTRHTPPRKGDKGQRKKDKGQRTKR